MTPRCQEAASVILRLIRTENWRAAIWLAYDVQTSVSGLQNGVQNSEDPTSWNLDVVINVFKTLLPNVSAHAVASGFDHRGFFLPNARAFVFLANAWKKLTPEPYPVTVSLVLLGALLHFNVFSAKERYLESLCDNDSVVRMGLLLSDRRHLKHAGSHHVWGDWIIVLRLTITHSVLRTVRQRGTSLVYHA